MYTQIELHSQVMPILWSKSDHDGNSQKSEQHLGSDSYKGTLRLRSGHTSRLSSYFHYSLLPRCHKDMLDRYQKIANWELHELKSLIQHLFMIVSHPKFRNHQIKELEQCHSIYEMLNLHITRVVSLVRTTQIAML